MVTIHSYKLFSSNKPAENPSTGCLHRSVKYQQKKIHYINNHEKQNFK